MNVQIHQTWGSGVVQSSNMVLTQLTSSHSLLTFIFAVFGEIQNESSAEQKKDSSIALPKQHCWSTILKSHHFDPKVAEPYYCRALNVGCRSFMLIL